MEVEGDALSPAMFIFGDSLVDDGNNNHIPTVARADYAPYGVDFGYPNGRFTNGLTVVDYGAKLLGLPLIPAYLSPLSKGPAILKGLNYASAAAGILDQTGRHFGSRISLNQQLNLFEKTVKVDLPVLLESAETLSLYLSESIFVVGIAGNDYINNYLLPLLYDSSRVYSPDAFADLLINTYSQQLRRLYGLGARKMVVVGVGPLGCLPSQIFMVNNNGSCVDNVNDLVLGFNDRLFDLIDTLNSTLPESFFIYQNAYSITLDIVTNPSSYGFTYGNTACCGLGRYGGYLRCLPLQPPCNNRDQYVFFDAFHPTSAVNSIIAERCYGESPTDDCYPIGVRELAQL
ncbi:hypothetical protein AMTR_s00006p00253020 [Amborella trichopoda]|uniref:GDSL esterase/lipase n=2 Tax=Amborella trichopoda TaxID=13333 RepID=W1PDJ3_AMBTC|nr:hypothetical protein AMTR_s00006p00253020 [Amborella trichopoda]